MLRGIYLYFTVCNLDRYRFVTLCFERSGFLDVGYPFTFVGLNTGLILICQMFVCMQ